MDSELRLQSEFRRALDEILPPAPWLEATVTEDFRRRLRSRAASRPALFPLELPPRSMRMLAAVLLVALALAGVGAFIAINQYVHRPIPIRIHHVTASAACSQGFHMVTSSAGWQGPSLHTTDGGVSWQDTPLPNIPNQTKGGRGECTLDGSHAWTTVATGTSLLQADHVLVLITTDGGQTWQQGGSVPATGLNTQVAIEFIDFQDGWLLTDTGTRTLYATTDGGYDWVRVSGGAALDQVARGCAGTGMTFVSSDRGWVTWDCSQGVASAPTGPSGPVVVVTNDGGRTWMPVGLPSFPSGTDAICGANPPLFTREKGVMPVSCSGAQPGAVYRTNDGGDSWVLGQAPSNFFQLSQIDFVDANTGFAFARSASNDSDLYKTVDSGSTWTVVTKSLFAGQAIESVQFVSPTTGFAFTSTSNGSPWETTDGGLTWSLPGHKTLPGHVGCPAASNPGTGGAPVPILMTSPTTGWAVGARRTTDGGLTWSEPGPSSVPERSSGYAEFFLDATHAWVAQTAGSSTACSDHVVVFSTSDGGQSWQQSAPIPVSVSASTDSIWGPQPESSSTSSDIVGRAPWLDFIDAKDGWMMVEVLSPGMIGQTANGPLYRTTDGGLHWAIVSQQPAPTDNCGGGGGAITFSSVTTGWMPVYNCGTNSSQLTYLVTHDGGVTWSDQTLGLDCGCQGGIPVFLDQSHGFLFAVGVFLLVTTSDGGKTWASHPLPAKETMWTVEFLDPSHGWAVIGDTGTDFQLKRTSDGGKTWSLVNASLPPAAANGITGYSLNFVNQQYGFWATGAALYRTTDGGRTWTQVQTTLAS